MCYTADNVLLQKESDCSIKVRIVDFGLASRIGEMGGEESFRLDIKETVRNFSGLYIGQTFGSAAVLNKPDDWMNAVAEVIMKGANALKLLGKLIFQGVFIPLFFFWKLMKYPKP